MLSRLAGRRLGLGGGCLGALLRRGMFPRFVLEKPESGGAQKDAQDQSIEKTSHRVPVVGLGLRFRRRFLRGGLFGGRLEFVQFNHVFDP